MLRKQNISVKFVKLFTCPDMFILPCLHKFCILHLVSCISSPLSFTHYTFCDIGRKAEAILDTIVNDKNKMSLRARRAWQSHF